MSFWNKNGGWMNRIIMSENLFVGWGKWCTKPKLCDVTKLLLGTLWRPVWSTILWDRQRISNGKIWGLMSRIIVCKKKLSTYIRLVGIAGQKKVDKNHLNTFLYWVFTSLWLSIHRFLLIWLMSRMQIQWKTIGRMSSTVHNQPTLQMPCREDKSPFAMSDRTAKNTLREVRKSWTCHQVHYSAFAPFLFISVHLQLLLCLQ